MSSLSDPRRKAAAVLEAWNRRLHYYLGLYFLLFIWLFSFTGLLLNHPRWSLSRIPNDANPAYERPIEPPRGGADLERARDVMRQLRLSGEIDWPQAAQAQGRLDFNIAYPKHATQVRVDLARQRATVQQVDRSLWSGLRIMHTFSGWRYTSAGTSRDWIVTSVWVVAMDALAAGLLVMVFGSYYMWWRLGRMRIVGWMALAAGWASCVLFVYGLGFIAPCFEELLH
jgi:hypothetical protein